MAISTGAASRGTSCCRAIRNGERVTVAGLVLVRQRPGTAKGVIFMTLEDETGIANTIVWARAFETFRPIVIGARLVAVTGPLQSASGVIHVVMEHIEDLTPLLRRLSDAHGCVDALAHADEARRPPVERHRHPRAGDSLVTLLKEAPDRGRTGRADRRGDAEGAQFPLSADPATRTYSISCGFRALRLPPSLS